MEDLKFTNAADYMDLYYADTLEELYEEYIDENDDGVGNDRITGEPLLTFDDWLNSQEKKMNEEWFDEIVDQLWEQQEVYTYDD